MKTAAVLLAGTLILSGATGVARDGGDPARALYIPGTYETLNIPRVQANFLACLTDGPEAVQESALGHIVWLKLMRNDVSCDAFRAEIDRLTTEGATASIRYRASLTNAVLDSPGTFAGLAGHEFESGNELFINVARTAQVTLLGAR